MYWLCGCSCGGYEVIGCCSQSAVGWFPGCLTSPCLTRDNAAISSFKGTLPYTAITYCRKAPFVTWKWQAHLGMASSQSHPAGAEWGPEWWPAHHLHRQQYACHSVMAEITWQKASAMEMLACHVKCMSAWKECGVKLACCRCKHQSSDGSKSCEDCT